VHNGSNGAQFSEKVARLAFLGVRPIVNVAFTQTGGDYGSTEEATDRAKRKVDYAPYSSQALQVCAGETGETDHSEGNPKETFGQG
jgi:hypothetical protein